MIKYLFLILFSVSSWASYNEEGKVIRVIDGDTYIIQDSSGNQFKTRILNIDTPESVHPKAYRNTPEGKEASNFVKGMIEGKSIRYQCNSKGDKYGRELCSVSFNGKDVGISIIEKGYSPYVTCWGKHKTLHKEYLAAAGKESCPF